MAAANPRVVTAMVWLLGLAVFINYVDRGTLGIAAPRMKADLGLSATQFGLAASAFFWVYAPGQLLMGWLVGRVNAAWLLAAGLAIWGVATALTGFVGGLVMLVALRLLLGLGEAVAFPAAFKLIVDHVEEGRRGAANAALSIGLALGPALGTLAGGLLLASLGWRWLFGAMGLLTLFWLLPWLKVARGLPQAPSGQETAGTPGYWRVLANRPALSLSLAQVCWGFALYFLVTWLPLWLVDVRGYAIADMAWLGSLVFAAQALAALIGGQVNDRLVSRGLPQDRVRRGGAIMGSLLSAAGVALIGASSNQPMLIAGLIVAGLGLGIMHICVNMIAQVFAGPLAAGKWVGVQNGIGNLAGITNPIITGAIVDATGSYGWAFAIAAAGPLIAAFSLAFLVPRVEPIDWAAQR